VEPRCIGPMRRGWSVKVMQWRKRSLGTASEKGNRWVERILSLQETCRLRAVSTSHVLVDAISSFFCGQQPDLTWLQ
jgi:transposase